MDKYDYEAALENDIRDYIKNYINLNDYDTPTDLMDDLNETLWDDDDITGNGWRGGYASEEECEQWVGQNLNLMLEALWSFDTPLNKIPHDTPARFLDTTIRCYLYDMCISNVVNDLWDERTENDEESSED